MIVILLKKHIEDLRRQSYENPLLKVPTGEDLAEVSGVTGSTISKIMQNNVKRLNLSVIDSIIAELRSRGFKTNISDIIEYIGPPVAPLGSCASPAHDLREEDESNNQSA